MLNFENAPDAVYARTALAITLGSPFMKEVSIGKRPRMVCA